MTEKEIIRKNVKVEVKRESPYGGQHVGVMPSIVVLKSEELDLEISVGFHRSQIKNAELAMTLFELALDELVK